MPFIVNARFGQEAELAAAPALAFSRGVGRLREALEARSAARREAQFKERQLDIEEQRAGASLLRERRMAAEIVGEAKQRDADRQAVASSLQEIATQRSAEAGRQAFLDAAKKPGGILGPLGVLNPAVAAKSATAMSEAQARMAPKVELARRMSPAAAREFLKRETDAEKAREIGRSFGHALEVLQDMAGEGLIDGRKAKLYSEAIQGAAARGDSPGPILQRIGQELDIHAKATARMEGWEGAQKEADELFRQIAAQVKQAKDYELRQRLARSLATARVEWARTKRDSFRAKHDAEDSLAGLERILYDGQAAMDPRGYAEGVSAELAGPETFGQPANGMNQPAPNPRQETPTQRAIRGRGKTRQDVVELKTPEQEALLQDFVSSKAQDALRAGGDRKARILKLRDDIARELRFDVNDPAVLAVVRDTLDRIYSGARARRAPTTDMRAGV